MTILSEVEYFRAREAQERAAHRKAANKAIGDIHFQMAERYADRVWSLEEIATNAPPVFASGDFISIDQAATAQIIAGALVEKFGFNALGVAAAQVDACNDTSRSTWSLVVSKLAASD